MRPGDKVRLTSHPALWPWVEEYVGEEAEVLESKENAVELELSDGPLWFANKHVEAIGNELKEEGAA